MGLCILTNTQNSYKNAIDDDFCQTQMPIIGYRGRNACGTNVSPLRSRHTMTF